jgi:hypothetical protein
MSDTPKNESEEPSLFIKAVNACHADLVAQREKVLIEMQLLERNPTGVDCYTFSVSEKLAKLSEIDSQIDTIKRYFSPNEKTGNKDS